MQTDSRDGTLSWSASTIRSGIARLQTRVASYRLGIKAALVALVLAFALTQPTTAQEAVGTVYCDTTVEQGIDVVFGAIAGLGLPATMLYMVRGGINYMRAGGRPKKKDRARDQFLMAGVGFAIIVLALAAPGIVSKLGGQLGFSFSACVRPF